MGYTDEKVIYSVLDIQRLLRHRYPFLLVDKIVEWADNERIVGVKAVTINEPFFSGHFPGYPVMPGVLVLEAMAQVGAVLALTSTDGMRAGKTVFLVGATDVKWKRRVVPGDLLHIEMVSVKKRRPLWIMNGTVTVSGTVVASATISAMEADAEGV